MTLRCDHCRGNLGLIVHRYWHMRYCSAACTEAYRQRLQDDTKANIRRFDCAARENPPIISRVFGSRALAGVTRHFAR